MKRPDLFARILEAQKRLRGQAHVTPIMGSRTLNESLGARFHFKCENLQRVGAFKFRGAYNALSRLSPEEKRRGVVTISSGNHAQAVALVGRELGMDTVVIMPVDAPEIKRKAVEGYGARIASYDPATTSRDEALRRVAGADERVFIPPFDHWDVIAGQGTAGLELAQAVSNLDMLLVPCGGGGLLSGCAAAVKGLFPECGVVGVEPESADDATRSFRTGVLQEVHNPPTLADGVRTPRLGEITFPLILRHVDHMTTVSEEAIREAVRFLFYRMKLVVEPSGALGLAAVLSGAVRPEGDVGILLSGGNVDGPTMAAILSEPLGP
ncbi:threonine dehydratase [Desulfacinum hydrothermale DSM 13146]|uniref:Threonine dehydratase n=1 Tax=Desulfacinum hydrothermale DSM 13146 TaxID=1121390 RepID=A0A1W1XUL3_9BACT|nr:pyridoxal-phosphate dependent enzyme [Desulfacinum hydrothermale]SMC27208.1 threonine dehydratase [Desulfacinum hydrothermale DSM 13146]